MHTPVPRVPEQPETNRAENEARLTVELSRLTVELTSVVAGARKRALRDGDRQIDTAHLLHSLIETDPMVAAAFEGPGRLARVLGYLVQRSIGYGLRWRGSVEDSGGVPVHVRERDVAGWSPAAVAAMAGALQRSALRGETRATGLDLLAALAGDPDCRAVEVLRRAGIEPGSLGGRIGDLSQQV